MSVSAAVLRFTFNTVFFWGGGEGDILETTFTTFGLK